MRSFVLAVTAIILAGCAQSGYKQFYKPYVDATSVPDVELIAEGQEPQVFGTDDFDRDANILLSRRYIPVGYSAFNGSYEDTKNAAAQAKSVGATIVLVSSQYTNTQTTTSALFLPDTRTTYHSGSVQGNTTYSGISTTYGTTAVPYTSHQRRYDQTAMYFVKSNQKYKYGVQFTNLTPAQRSQYERNTGVVINIVIEDSPAFLANVLAGDVLIAIDGTPVRNVDHATQVMGSVPSSQDQSILRVIRNGEEKDIEVMLKNEST